jgi:hypothetical protein
VSSNSTTVRQLSENDGQERDNDYCVDLLGIPVSLQDSSSGLLWRGSVLEWSGYTEFCKN